MIVHRADQLARCPARRVQSAGQRVVACNPRYRPSVQCRAHILLVATTIRASAHLSRRRSGRYETCRVFRWAAIADCTTLFLSPSNQWAWKWARPATVRTDPTDPRESQRTDLAQ